LVGPYWEKLCPGLEYSPQPQALLKASDTVFSQYMDLPAGKQHIFSSSLFFRDIYLTSFSSAVKDVDWKKKNTKKTVCTSPTFSHLKLLSCPIQCTVKILEDFTEGNSRKSQIK